MFTSYQDNDDDLINVVFSDNSEGKVVGVGKIAITTDHTITHVLHVDSLNYNLLSVSQLCLMSYNCLFDHEGVTVFRRSDDSIAFKGVLKGKLDLVNFALDKAELSTCLVAKTNMG